MRKLEHSGSSEVSNLKWPRMTSDDHDTWRAFYSLFVGLIPNMALVLLLTTSLRLRIAVKLEKKLRFKWAKETAYGTRNLAWPWPRGNCIWLLDIHKHQLCCLQWKKNTQGSKETHPDSIDRKVRWFRPNMTSCLTPYLRDLTWPDPNIKCIEWM